MSTQQNKQQEKQEKQQQQQTIYAVIPDNSSWEDIIIFLSLKDAENALNNDFPKRRIEHFVRSEPSGGYIPSYLVTYGKNWNTNTNHNVMQNPTNSKNQLEIKDNLPIFTKYYPVSEQNDHQSTRCSSR